MALRPLIAALASLLTLLSSAGAAAAATATTTASTPDKFAGLLANSPFGMARSNGAGGGPAEPLEFRAVLEENGNRIFSIYETAAHRANWVDLNDPVNDFSVKEYDVANNSVTVEYQGKALKLALKRAAPVIVAAAPTAVPSPGTGAMPANRPAPVVQVQAPQQQIQQIRDEINRRRAARQQPVATPSPPNRP